MGRGRNAPHPVRHECWFVRTVPEGRLGVTQVDVLHHPESKSVTIGSLEGIDIADEHEVERNIEICHSLVYCALQQSSLLVNLDKAHSLLKKIYLASCVIILDSHDHVLITQRHSTMTFPNSWVVPGGKVDHGETFREAAVREVREEVGVEVKDKEIEAIFMYESSSEVLEDGEEKAKNHIMVMFYVIHLTDHNEKVGVKVQESEVQSHEWIRAEELYHLMKHDLSKEELIEKYGKQKYVDFSRMHPNDHERGVPEGHCQAFTRYYERVLSKNQQNC